MLYSRETWTITEKNKSFRDVVLQKNTEINLDRYGNNKEVLERMSERKTLWSSINKRINVWIGHVLRHSGLLGIIIEGCIEGKNARGRSRMEYMQQIPKD